MAKPLWEQALEHSARRAEMPRLGDAARSPAGLGTPSGLVAIPAPAKPSPDDARIAPDQLQALVRAVYRQGDILMLPFTVGAAPVQLRPAAQNRRYLFLQNQHAANTMVLGIGTAPGPSTGVPVAGLVIPPAFGFYEPTLVPQGEIWIVASAAATNGILLYSE